MKELLNNNQNDLLMEFINFIQYYDSYTFKPNEVLMEKAIYLGFAVLELSKLRMYESLSDKLQPYFVQKNLQIHYVDTDSFVSSVNTKEIFKNSETIDDLFDFSNLIETHDKISRKKAKK